MIRRDPWRILLFASTVLSVIHGCQNYGFQELPSTVVKESRTTTVVNVSPLVDILFVIDNSKSMEAEQQQLAESFSRLRAKLDEKFGADKYTIAVVTTGMFTGVGCQPCPADTCNSTTGICTYSSDGFCINTTGESGRFQNRLGKYVTMYDFITDSTCRVVTSSEDSARCFYNDNTARGISLVGPNGCGYERGLAAMKAALSAPLISSTNTGFLRENAVLVIIVVSDEEDCGEIGDVVEEQKDIYADVCYYAAKGTGPTGTTYNALEPVDSYYDFLMNLKGNRVGMVKFAAIVGMKTTYDGDGNPIIDPDTTTIEYNVSKKVIPACTTPSPCDGGTGNYCTAYPGTRYIALAKKFMETGVNNGYLDTICQNDFSKAMENIGTVIACPRIWTLTQPLLAPSLANILVNGVEVPRHSCVNTTSLIPCPSTADNSPCNGAACVETWSYNDVANTISFASHYDPCNLVSSGQIRIELVYATE